MFRDKIDRCIHVLTTYIGSTYDYCDFILEYRENVVESCLHQVKI
ncbi:hypothetical protein [Clostridioides difficile]